mgnify:CR=1 FL=1
MRITTIEFAGTPKTTTRDGEGLARAFARIERKPYSDEIEVTILTPGGEETVRLPAKTQDAANIRERVETGDPLWAMAERLQETLDGCVGTNSMVHDYFRELQRLAD